MPNDVQVFCRPGWLSACTVTRDLMKDVATYDGVRIPQEGISGETRRVIEVDPDTDPRYEAFVNAHPDAIIYHHPAWLQVLVRENGNKPICLACEDVEGRLSGVLALFPTRGLPFRRGELTGRRLSSLPRTPMAGPLTSDRASTAALLHAAAEHAYENRGMQLQIKVASDELDNLAPVVVGARWRPCYVVELPERIEDLRFGNSRNHARIRSTVNKAEKMNLRLREANSEHDLRM